MTARSVLNLLALLLYAATLCCGPVQVGSAASVQRCPVACPPACPSSCLASGYCTEVVRTAANLGLAPIPQGGQWFVSLPGFPPNQDITFSINAGFDFSNREGQLPAYLHIAVSTNGTFEAFLVDGSFDAFPVWASFQAHLPADATGLLELPMGLLTCNGTTCSIDPESTFAATLTNAEPWLLAPPCYQEP